MTLLDPADLADLSPEARASWDIVERAFVDLQAVEARRRAGEVDRAASLAACLAAEIAMARFVELAAPKLMATLVGPDTGAAFAKLCDALQAERRGETS